MSATMTALRTMLVVTTSPAMGRVATWVWELLLIR